MKNLTLDTKVRDSAARMPGATEARGLTLPEGVCGSWTVLCAGVPKPGCDLVAPIHLEDTVLFARF